MRKTRRHAARWQGNLLNRHHQRYLAMAAAAPSGSPDYQPDEGEIKALMERLSMVRTKLLALIPFLGHLCLALKPRIARPEENCPTAGVARDGSLILNYTFCSQLGDPELAGLLCHEVMHPALKCWARQQGRMAIVSGPGGKFTLWNVAHDLSFNGMIEEMARNHQDKIKLPKEAAVEAKYYGMSAEEIYDVLLKEAEQNGGGDGGCTGSIGVPGLSGGGIGDDMRDDLAETKDGQKAAKGDTAAQNHLENEWKVNVVAASQIHSKEKGDLPLGIQKYVDELTDPKVDWVTQLSMWVGENGRRSDYSFRRPARRSESVGEYLPSLTKYGVDDIVILWDTSGSMNGRETEILSELQGICEDLGLALRIICCDTAVHSDVDNVAEALEIIPHIKGGGGSDFRPAFDRLEEEDFDGCVIAFTDGYIDVPKTQPHQLKGMLWAIGPNDVDPTHGKWGEVLVIEDAFQRA